MLNQARSYPHFEAFLRQERRIYLLQYSVVRPSRETDIDDTPISELAGYVAPGAAVFTPV